MIIAKKTKPFIGIVNTWNDISLSNHHLQDIAQATRDGVLAGGGQPISFYTIAVSDGYAFNHEGMDYVLPSREIIADSIEMMALAHHLDGLVILAGGDKPIPAALMASLRLNLPAIIINGGYSLPQKPDNTGLNSLELLYNIDDYSTGLLTEDFIQEAEETAITGAGDGAGMYTPNSMACLAEALGLSLPFSSTVAALSAKKLHFAHLAGEQVCNLVRQDLRPRRIVTMQALENAIRIGMAIGVSTNTVIHLLAIAREACLPLSLRDFQRISETSPLLCPINPNGPYHLHDLDNAGGIPGVMSQIKHTLHLEALTVTGKTIGENIASALTCDETVIRPFHLPVYPKSSIRIIYGNLAPDGAVTRPLTIVPHLWRHQGTAKVFTSEKGAIDGIYSGKVERGNIVVLSHKGPKGGPGMQEVYGITSAISRLGLSNSIFLLTDGRFNGANFCACIGHICPEAAEGGPIAAVQDGDQIHVDIENGTINLLLSQEEIQQRLAHLPVYQPRITNRYLRRYTRLVRPACEGAVLQ